VKSSARFRRSFGLSGVSIALVVAAMTHIASAQPADAGEPEHVDINDTGSGSGSGSDSSETGSGSAAQPLDQPAQPKVPEGEDKTGTEVGLLPLIGGDTDNGFGIGAIGSVASFDATHTPYKWQVQFATFIATKTFPTPSYEDGFINVIAPQMLDGHLRLEIRPSFTRETSLRFFGLGNQINVPSQTDATRDFYTRLHPQLQMLTRWKLDAKSPWSVIAAYQYLYNRISEDPTSTLAQQLPTIDPKADTPHSVLRLETGIAYDSRDNEIAPNNGMFHTLEYRFSPHIGSAFPYQYHQADIQLRFYKTVIPKRTVLAVRVVGDFMLGDVPFYELSRYEDTSAIGGSLAIRGVPGYQFYGKVKVFGNVELRTAVTNFGLLDRKFKFGIATFFDAGRLWSDLRNSRPDLDGTGLGLHYGVGAGIRLQQGRAFLVRADLAWSPDASPIAGYVLADHIF
jgi:Omp85 superfamily domain